MRRRLRPAYPTSALHRIYAEPHDSDRWPDHQQRVRETIRIIGEWVGPVTSAADLSCGNGRILAAVEADERTYGDLAPGWPITGPIEETLPELEAVDLLIMSETVEHLDNPDEVLATARAACDTLVLSTPTDEWEHHRTENAEHYWSWGLDDVRAMLTAAGFTDLRCAVLPLGYYDYQVWVAQ